MRRTVLEELVGEAYRVDIEIPRLSRLIEVDDNFLVRQIQLFQGDVSTVSPRTQMVGIQGDLRGNAHV